jgi:hydrogenase maturation protease
MVARDPLWEGPVPLLVLGLGNVLCADDGLGVVAVAHLAEDYEVPEGVQVLDGGTLGLSLLPYVEEAETLILVDAVRTDAPPGSPVRMEGDEVGPAIAHRLSPHQVGVADLMDAARLRGRYPREVVLLGLVPESLETRLGLSGELEAAVPALVERVAEEARRLGQPLMRREPDGKAALPFAPVRPALPRL